MDIFKKDTIIKRTIELAGKINKLENDVADLAVKLATAERELEEKEAELILNGTVDGKNAEVRKAQLLQHTKNELDRIAKIKADYTKKNRLHKK